MTVIDGGAIYDAAADPRPAASASDRRFTHRMRPWLVDLDDLPHRPPLADASRRATTSAGPTARSGRTSTTGSPAHGVAARAGG